MAMQQRERMLALALGSVVGVVFLYWAYTQYASMFSTRRTKLNNLSTQIQKKETQLARIRSAVERRRELEKRSLPTNPTEAENRYHDWLLSLVNGKLGEPNVSPRAVPMQAKAYKAFDFEVKGEGTLEQVAKVLYDFYSANHLHQVTSLILKPQEKTGKLDLTMKVQAITLPGANRNDTLTTEPGDNLAFQSYSDYQKAIVERNLFAEYKAPQPPPTVVTRPPEPTFDFAKVARITNIGHGTDGRAFAWIHEGTTGKKTELFAGEEFQIAGLKGTVQSIDLDDKQIVLLIDGNAIVFSQYKSLGETLADRQKMQK